MRILFLRPPTYIYIMKATITSQIYKLFFNFQNIIYLIFYKQYP